MVTFGNQGSKVDPGAGFKMSKNISKVQVNSFWVKVKVSQVKVNNVKARLKVSQVKINVSRLR